MPQGDHRGPNGEGPKTGRGMGLCRGQITSGSLNTPHSRALVSKGKYGRGSAQGFGQSQRMERSGWMGWHA